MAIFAVLSEKAINEELGSKIAEVSADILKLGPTHWLIEAESTARSLADALDIREGKFGRVIVLQALPTGSGWEIKSLWDWLNSKADN